MNRLHSLTIDQYRPTELWIECRRCRRSASATKTQLKARYGNVTLRDAALRVAADGNPPCNLAGVEGNAFCGATPIEPPVEAWATLTDARLGGWEAWLHCGRRHAALKKAKSCPHPFPITVHSLLALLPWDYPLARLPSRLHCPECGTEFISIEWLVLDEAPPPEPAVARSVPPSTAQLIRRLRVVKGG